MTSLFPIPSTAPAITLRPYQREAVDAVYRHLRGKDDNPCIVLPTGCHAAGHPILMHDGSIRPVEHVQIGDDVMGPDSRPRRVLALCRGNGPMYRITPHRGEPFTVNDEHVLSLVCTNEGKGRFPSQKRGGEIDNISVNCYLAKSRSWRHLRKLRRTAVDFQRPADLPVPSYILGLLLGDGCIKECVALTTGDEEITQVWMEYAQQVGCRIREKPGRGCSTYHLVGRRRCLNPVTDHLRQLGLAGKTSDDKFVPFAYRTASREDRLDLLAGLFDADGCLSHGGIDFVTKSPALAEHVAFVARSVGLAARVGRKISTCQTGVSGTYWRVSVSGRTEMIPSRLARRTPVFRRQKKCVLRSGFTVTPVGSGEFFGFTLDGDHLYVDGHFVVHHNSGKTPVIASICRDTVQLWGGRVLVLAHVRELLEQAVDKLQAMAPDLAEQIGVHSAGLNSRDTSHPILVAGIQSIYQKAEALSRFDLVLVDEAHMIPMEGDGMYRRFLEDARKLSPHLRVVGLTATPFRLASGTICTPEGILNTICYEVGVRELIRDGFLSPLRSKAGKNKARTDDLHVRAGEFIASEVESLMDQDYLVTSACREIIEQTRDRHSVLIFASGVKHGEHVAKVLEDLAGCECGFLDGQTPTLYRDGLIQRFRSGALKYLCNVNVLTTGFDAPNVDCVVLLRPTMSPGLFYQMCGRGFRLHPGKTDCLVLDFGGNVLRHGPVDQIRVAEAKTKGTGEAPAKECPQCQALIATGYARCPECGHEFPPPNRRKHDAEATADGVLAGQVTLTEHEVHAVQYSVHVKRDAPEDAPRSMRVDYEIGFYKYQSEWVCFEHTGYARQKAEGWWRARSHAPVPATSDEAVALAEAGALATPSAITVRHVAGEKFDRISDYQLGAIPEAPDVGDLTPTQRQAPEPEYAAFPDDDIPF